MRNHHLDHRDDGQNKEDGKDDTAHDIGRCRSPGKIPDTIFRTLNTESSRDNAAHDVKKTGLVLWCHGLLILLALGFEDLVADGKTDHHDNREDGTETRATGIDLFFVHVAPKVACATRR